MPERLLSHLEHRRDEMVDLLTEWVNCDSPSLEKPLVDGLGKLIRQWAERHGAETELFPQAEYGDHMLLRWEGPSAVAPILLLAHMDTVWPAGEAERRPARLEGDYLSGPGVYDMKSGLVQGLYAIQALRELGRELKRPLMLFVNSDEEIGSPSSRTLIEGLAREAAAVLVLEPTTGDGALKTARKGIARYALTVSGRAAHAGAEPEKGVSAMLELAHQIKALHELNDFDRGVSVTVGEARGGSAPNVIPAAAEATIDMRGLTADDMERMDRAIHSLEPRLEGAELHISGGINRPPMERTDAIAALFHKAQRAADELGFAVDESTTGGGSDGNFTAAAGTPTLDGLGAVGGGAHALDEHIDITEMPRRAALIARLLETI